MCGGGESHFGQASSALLKRCNAATLPFTCNMHPCNAQAVAPPVGPYLEDGAANQHITEHRAWRHGDEAAVVVGGHSRVEGLQLLCILRLAAKGHHVTGHIVLLQLLGQLDQLVLHKATCASGRVESSRGCECVCSGQTADWVPGSAASHHGGMELRPRGRLKTCPSISPGAVVVHESCAAPMLPAGMSSCALPKGFQAVAMLSLSEASRTGLHACPGWAARPAAALHMLSLSPPPAIVECDAVQLMVCSTTAQPQQ